MEAIMIGVKKEEAKIILDALFKYSMNGEKRDMIEEFREQLEKAFVLQFKDWHIG